MLARLWGTRGSIPVAMQSGTVAEKVARALVAADGRRFADMAAARAFADTLPMTTAGSYGGATACIEIEGGDDSFMLCDFGSGCREFGLSAAARVRAGERPPVYNVFMSHMHWDHIMGFPYFVPAFDPRSRIVIHGGHDDVERALRRQQEEISFPVPFDYLAADISFELLEPDVHYEIGGLDVSLIKQHHSHDSYGYRFADRNGAVVYSTDSEHRAEDMTSEAEFVAFFRNADLVIFDTMYSLGESDGAKADWGHSSNIVGVDLCHLAGVKRLALFHHEPTYSDDDIAQIYNETVTYEALTRDDRPELEVICGYDGLEIAV
jgi:phosphoribosyl 1,2-cyclic phosphodiesterase